MRYIVVVFSSRTETIKFYNILKNYGTFTSIINTPRSLSKSCGVSVKINSASLNLAKQILNQNIFATFKGIYEVVLNSSNLPIRIY